MTLIALFRSLSATALTCAAVVTLSACSQTTVDDAAASRSVTTQHPTPSSPASTPGTHYTIADYVRDTDIAEVAVKQGDSTAPRIVLPELPGWVEATRQAPAGTYRALKYTPGIAATDYSPNVVVFVSKLTGRVIDPDKILAAAPGELHNLEGFAPIGKPGVEKLAGYQAYKIAGTYRLDGADTVVGQSTLILPGTNTAYLVQINITGAASQIDIVKAAARAIDKGLTIQL
ncbi:hypothetical protein HH308_08800 [Gordonia sp. TBRC 11910]|uniref:Lipoprotein LpqN n=1 Tax=Gordonia asplenii TaxID=2725283 RepID=A0A848KY03_9ACTN|nr:LpqN/LpqT family lipoprotein [Gordonia asplenii]NMO01313.1 hypothetical protein [Gordonia asplenii]